MEASEAFELGCKFLDKNDYENALLAFNEAIRSDAKFAQAYNGRGVTLALKGMLPQALLDCCEAIRLDPEDPEFYRSRGYIYHKMGDLRAAKADLAKAMELESKLSRDSVGNPG